MVTEEKEWWIIHSDTEICVDANDLNIRDFPSLLPNILTHVRPSRFAAGSLFDFLSSKRVKRLGDGELKDSKLKQLTF